MLRNVVLAALLAPCLAAPATAQDDCRLYTYRATVTQVMDGDTVRANVDLGFRIWVNNETFRLYGIDAPETRLGGARNVTEAEKARGLAAKAALAAMVEGKDVLICTIRDRQEKYGRYLARIFLDDLDVNEWLVETGHAIPYGDDRASLN